MFKYILKRIGLMLMTFFIIMTMCFFLVKLLPDPITCQPNTDSCSAEIAWREALGYDKPLLIQYGIFLNNLFTKFSWGVGFKMYFLQSVTDIMMQKLPYTLYVNFLSIILSVPLGLIFGTFAALKKNKWQDQLISVGVMVVISIPSYVYCFIIQYALCFKLGWFPLIVSSSSNFMDPKVFYSYLPAVICLSLGVIAGLTRYTRAELTEVLTSDFMLLARAKGLSRGQATVRHAFRNAMVPIFPMIMGQFIGILGGSLIVENFFSIPGVGQMYIKSINVRDYNFFMFLSMFYVAIGLVASLLVDLSYGIVDPRIRIGAKK